MNPYTLTMLIMLTLSGCGSAHLTPPTPEPWYPAVNANHDPVFVVFESRIPCAECEKIKVALVLYRHRATNVSTTYTLARVYVAQQPDERIVVEGTWTITRGTSLDPNAIVYQLDASAPQEFRAYWAVGQDLLFILDQARGPRIGTASYSYALNRTR